MLRLLGLPTAEDMSGRVLDEAFRIELFPESTSAESVRTYERKDPIARVEATPSPEADEALRKRLKSLGYIQ